MEEMSVRLNKEQSQHLANTVSVIALLGGGYFVYQGMTHSDWPTIVWSGLAFLILEGYALYLLKAA